MLEISQPQDKGLLKVRIPQRDDVRDTEQAGHRGRRHLATLLEISERPPSNR